MIVVSFNGESLQLEQALSVEKLLQQKALHQQKVAVAINSEFVPRSSWSQRMLQDQDQVDVLTAVQGG